ncbi:LAGLIDADG family homing endonuclease [Patescibacteria group bacterium]|nr:LAGLIDADG family homing endonuclease [Patescibacteria group bacterium]
MTYSAFREDQSENLRLYDTPTPKVLKAYLLGALHYATERKYTYRISQKSVEYVRFIKKALLKAGYKAWTYKEGSNRDVHIVEFSKKILSGITILSRDDKINYCRGYFDSEGAVPLSLTARYYIYFAQKDIADLTELRDYLQDLRISCGKIHNPSKRVDSDYFRFYVLSSSFEKFAKVIGSWHPIKQSYLRMKI